MKDNRNSPHIAIMTAAVITLVSFFFSLGLFPVNANIAKADSDDLLSDLINIISEYSEDDTYAQYYEKYSGGDRPDLTVRIEGEDYTEANGGSFEIVNNYMGLEGSAVLTPESGIISWSAKIEKPGLYNIRVHYFPVDGKSAAIERSLLINNEIPFKEAELIMFDRIWDNRDNEIKRDDRNNELRPVQIEKPKWILEPMGDRTGYHTDPYLFYFDKGEHIISLAAVREPMAVDYIELYREEEVKTYEEIKKEYEENGLKPTKHHLIKVQAEDAVRKSSPTLYPISDRSSPLMEPYHVSKIRMNAIGGYNWRVPGQWIEWEIEVPETGLYQIAFKRKQDFLRGIYTTRSLTIDGKHPFEEMKCIRFNFNRGWQTDILGDEEPYLFYLTEGTHQIRLSVTLGDIAPLIKIIENSVLKLNETYRKVVMITSTSPDPYRDYQLERRIPNLLNTLDEQARIIEKVADYLVQLTGEKSDMIAPLYNLSSQLKDIVKRPETLPRRLDTFRTNVGALGTWILTVKEQPLALDYLAVFSPGQTLPRAGANIWETLKHEIGSFFSSYTEDYSIVGNIADADKSVSVWVTTGRDQAQTIKAMIDDEFTPKSNISVKLKLVPGNILLPATLAGEGPDIAMQVGEDIPVNYGMRNAVEDLTQFPDFEEVAGRFHESALLPYRYEKGVFALPEQQIFPVMFYRKDILEELDLEPPKTWDEVYYVISVLKKHNLDFYLPIESIAEFRINFANLVPNAAYAMLLYQNGGEFYQENGIKSGLDSEIAIEVFRKWTRFYTNYKLPIQADFVNRFRTGEMPIGIANYNVYNTLVVFAPEIKGLWDFTVVPGTLQADGSLRHNVASSTFAIIMLKNAEDKQSAWEFMKWWTNKETQVWFGREMEALMGEAARYPTANIAALEELPWPVDDYNNLMEQWKWVEGIPQVPGGYFTGRHLDNAFRKVVNSGENYREALLDYVIYINDEIKTKRQEFNLPY
ncbi:MAG: extracellular solute-binding protein [Caldicoprobacteraceae bacterium]|jgi:ABC-type glycerol-3-phosphate transport system substrate-binding protein